MRRYNQNSCFASNRGSIATDALGHRIVSRDEAHGRGPFCRVMRDKFFRQMMDDRACGSKACPFYKLRRMDIRKD